MTDDTRAVIVERDFQHPPERLWRALTQPHLIEEWLMKTDLVPEVGHRFTMRGEWGGVLECEMQVVKPNGRLAYRWDFPNQNPAFDVRTVVTFTLTPIQGGTRLRVEQAGFRPEQNQAYGGAKLGWPNFLGKLESVLNRIA